MFVGDFHIFVQHYQSATTQIILLFGEAYIDSTECVKLYILLLELIVETLVVLPQLLVKELNILRLQVEPPIGVVVRLDPLLLQVGDAGSAPVLLGLLESVFLLCVCVCV